MLGKDSLKPTVFFKELQFRFKTWKNGIEIAFAYTGVSKSTVIFSRLFTKGIRVVLFLSLLGAGFVTVFTYRDKIKAFVSGKISERMSVIKTVKSADNLANTTKNTNHQNDTVTMFVATDTASLKKLPSYEIESTFVEEPKKVEIAKPGIIKYEVLASRNVPENFIIVVNKAYKALYLLQNQDTGWNVVREYDVAIGEQQGRKIHAGDRRTPEGQYFIIGRKERSELSLIYGPLAYVLNYPNEEDILAGRTGQGIWIHGTHPDSLPLETRGCVEMNNEDLKELSKIVKAGLAIPVLILNDEKVTDIVSAPDYERCRRGRTKILDDHLKTSQLVEQFVVNWKSFWETKNIDGYEVCYDTLDFNSQGLDWKGWKERKLRTFGLYDTIAITIDNIRVTDYNEYTAVVKFYQIYQTNLNKNENAKKLFLKKADDTWKITGESTCSKEELLL